MREKAEKLTIEKTNEENKKDIYKEKFNISESLRYLNPQIADAEEKKSKMERNIKIRVLRNQFFCLCGIIICVVSTNRVVSDNWDLLEPKIWLGGILITMITKFISVKVLANYFDANHIINDPNSKYYKKYSKKYNYCRTEHGNLKMTYAESEELLEKLDG